MCARPFEGDEPEFGGCKINYVADLWVVFQHASSARAARAKGKVIDMKIMTIAIRRVVLPSG